MESLRYLYKIGAGPSSSHTMGPQAASLKVSQLCPNAIGFRVTLCGSLALTGKGHLTDYIIEKTLSPKPVNFVWKALELPYHPNGMIFEALDSGGMVINSYTIYSIGGGSIVFDGEEVEKNPANLYLETMDQMIEYMETKHLDPYEYVLEVEGEGIRSHLLQVMKVMFETVEKGLNNSGIIPGKLQLTRVANSLHMQAMNCDDPIIKEKLLISAYAYAVSEENASGGIVVTAPTCGASGVIPGILYYLYHHKNFSKDRLVRALAVGGLFGNTIKSNATISGAEGGCQAEVGTACTMAAAMYAYLQDLNIHQIEYAAEIAMEHHLGLTCDPVGGYVQIPCIERNGIAALRAIDAATYARYVKKVKDNKVSFDTVVNTMMKTGKDLKSEYRETSLGGLATEFDKENRLK